MTVIPFTRIKPNPTAFERIEKSLSAVAEIVRLRAMIAADIDNLLKSAGDNANLIDAIEFARHSLENCEGMSNTADTYDELEVDLSRLLEFRTNPNAKHPLTGSEDDQ